MFEYECPNCGTTMVGSFGENVTCSKCNRSYETDCDLFYTEDDYSWCAWIVGIISGDEDE